MMRGNLPLLSRCPLTIASMMLGWSEPKLTKQWVTPASEMASKKADEAVYMVGSWELGTPCHALLFFAMLKPLPLWRLGWPTQDGDVVKKSARAPSLDYNEDCGSGRGGRGGSVGIVACIGAWQRGWTDEGNHWAIPMPFPWPFPIPEPHSHASKESKTPHIWVHRVPLLPSFGQHTLLTGISGTGGSVEAAPIRRWLRACGSKRTCPSLPGP